MFSWERESHYASLVYNFLRVYFSYIFLFYKSGWEMDINFQRKDLLNFKV